MRLIESERELDRLRASGAKPGQIVPLGTTLTSASPEMRAEQSVSTALHELYRLGDYFARGQQLVTMLVAQGRQTPQVKEAMRRVDWNFVCETAPEVIRGAIKELQEAQVRMRDAAEQAAKTKPKSAAAEVSEFQTSFFASR